MSRRLFGVFGKLFEMSERPVGVPGKPAGVLGRLVGVSGRSVEMSGRSVEMSRRLVGVSGSRRGWVHIWDWTNCITRSFCGFSLFKT